MPKYPDANSTFDFSIRLNVDLTTEELRARIPALSEPQPPHPICVKWGQGQGDCKLDKTRQTKMSRSMRTKERAARRAAITTKRSYILTGYGHED